jgi:hypothetical protein
MQHYPDGISLNMLYALQDVMLDIAWGKIP